MREALLGLILVATAFVGCIGTVDESPDAPGNLEAATASADEAHPNVTINEDDRVRVQVPVDVALVGFPAETAEALADRLEPTAVDHFLSDYPPIVHTDETPPELFPGSGADFPNPTLPVANHTVHHLPGLAEELADQRETWTVEAADAEDTIYDAAAVERFLAERLPDHGVSLDDGPTLVLLHDGSPGDHAYRYGYPAGYLEPVRAFGGHSPMLALDVSASEDPWVQEASSCDIHEEVQPYCSEGARAFDEPLPAEGQATVEALAGATEAATEFRLLQGPLYPPPEPSCVGVTLVVGIETTAAMEEHPDRPTAEEAVDEDRLRSAFANVTGPMEVHVDLDVRQLPQDDPALDALSESPHPETVRAWVHDNWEDYWVAHEGCEALVSFLIVGDGTQSDYGMALWDGKNGYRLSYSEVSDPYRLAKTYEGPGADESEMVGQDPSEAFDPMDRLLAHETGHLLGMRHPHDVSRTEGNAANVMTFSSTQSVMSYQTGDRLAGFTPVEEETFLRNRAGVLVQTAIEADLEGSPAFEQALDAIDDRRWEEANRVLGDRLADEVGPSHKR